jgi:hypothetical protein
MNDEEAEIQLQRLVDQALLAGQDDSPHNLFNGVFAHAKSSSIPFDAAVVLEHFWHLARIGAVAVPGSSIHALPFKMPQLLLTERGRQLLAAGDASPHNPSRYLNAVRKRIAQPDDVVVSYLREAVEAWRCGLSRSSLVMLGCACERLVLMLAEAIASRNCPPWSAKLDKKLKTRVFISDVFDDVRDALMNLREDKRLPKDLGDALDRKLTAIFDHARGLRNQSGHPTGADVTGEDAEGGLLLFPGFCALVDKLVQSVNSL